MVKKRDKDIPILEPNLSLAFLHAQKLAYIPAACCSGTAIDYEKTFEVDELLGGDARPFPFFLLGLDCGVDDARRGDVPVLELAIDGRVFGKGVSGRVGRRRRVVARLVVCLGAHGVDT